MPERHPWLAALGSVVLLAAAGQAGEPLPPVASQSLADLPLEALMEIEVISVSRKAQRLGDTAAAVSVITGEEIRRSGATRLADVLRMVPGLQVAHISANRWALSSRGFNEDFANKLLVRVDGRSVYTPLFSGVFWDVQEVMLEDVERVEVIRGPGASVWGANAVNGVINVITRAAADTHGGQLAAGGGSEERRFAALRWGGALANGADLRVWGRHFDHDGFETASGDPAGDDWRLSRGGFRLDWAPIPDTELSFQGDMYRGEVGERHTAVTSFVPAAQPLRQEDVDVEGWNGLLRWTQRISETSELSVQTFADRTTREIEFASETRHTFDVDLQHRFALGERQQIVWGLGYRWSHDRTRGSLAVTFDPISRTDDLWSAFVQDEIALLPARLDLTLGSKLEYNDYTGVEVQPTARLRWRAHESHVIWAAVSRAVRTPSRAGHDVIFNQSATPLPPAPFPAPISQVVRVRGDDMRSEELVAWEAGWRFTPSSDISLDVAGFLNRYDELRSVHVVGIDPFSTPGAVIVESRFGNGFRGRTWGTELEARWRPLPRWQITGAWSFLRLDLDAKPGSTDPTSEATTEGSVPTHTLHLRSFLDLPAGFELDALVWWVENLPSRGVDSYLRVDARVGWRVREGLRLSLIGRDLLESRHAEFGDTPLWPASEVERGVYGKLEWSW